MGQKPTLNEQCDIKLEILKVSLLKLTGIIGVQQCYVEESMSEQEIRHIDEALAQIFQALDPEGYDKALEDKHGPQADIH